MGEPNPRWYQNAVIYQIPVALFQDTTGNGWGDLAGVTSRLQHVKDLGADAVWLQPFYRSPFVDGGYDVTDHTEVSDRFGTIEDFKTLMRRADDLGIEVIVDLVVQHTSSDHPWFHLACQERTSPYRDYYIWADEPTDVPVSPVFPTVEDSVWTRSDVAGQYYRHTFYRHEPDLNIANPEVRGEISRIMEFWLDLGVAGFRIDALPYIVAEAAGVEGRDDGFWFLEEICETVRRHRPDAVVIAEADVEVGAYAHYFGTGQRCTMLLNFWLNNTLFLALARQEAEPLRRGLEMQPKPPEGCHYAISLRNHDELDLERLGPAEREEVMAAFAPHPQMRAFGRGIRRRLAPMLHDPRQRKLAIFLLCALPGTPVVLYGDEIGMGDQLQLPDRAALRPPMQWDNGPNAGFSSADPVQLVHPVIDEGPFGYPQVNVENERSDPDSLLRTLQTMFRVRREHGPLLSAEARPVEVDQEQVLAITYRGDSGTSLLLANLSPKRTAVTLPGDLECDWEDVLSDNPYDDESSPGAVRVHGYGFRWLVSAS